MLHIRSGGTPPTEYIRRRNCRLATQSYLSVPTCEESQAWANVSRGTIKRVPKDSHHRDNIRKDQARLGAVRRDPYPLQNLDKPSAVGIIEKCGRIRVNPTLSYCKERVNAREFGSGGIISPLID